MAKPLKLILALFAGLLLLLAAAIVALPFLFDPNDFRGKLAEAVKKETGREFTVGEIRLSVFPWLRVEIADAALGNAPGFGAEPMLRVQVVDVGAKLMPLLREGRIEASELRLSGVRGRLAVNAEGLSNWEDLLALQKPGDAAKDPAGGAGSGLDRLDIAGVELDDLALEYSDARTGQSYSVEQLRLKTGRLKAGETFPLEGAFRLGAKQPAATVAMDFDAQLSLAEDGSGSLRLSELRLKLDGEQAAATPAESLAARLELRLPQLDYDAAAGSLSAAGLAVDIQQLRFGSAQQPGLLAQGQLKADLRSSLSRQSHSLKALDLALALSGSRLPAGKAQALELSGGALEADLAAGSATVSGLKLDIAGLQLSSRQLLVEGLNAELASLGGDLVLAPFSPRQLASNLGIALPPTADAKVLQSASLSAQLKGSSRSAALKELSLKLDDSTLRGELAVRDFASQALAFALTLDSIDLDRYLPPPAKAAAGAEGKPAASSDINAIELPVSALEQLNAEGSLAVGKLKLKGLSLADVRLKLDAPRGGSKRQQLSATLYGGRAEMAMDLKPAAKPGYAIKTTLSGVNAGPLLKDFLGKDYVSGKGSLSLDLRSGGRTVGELRKALNGDVAFNFVDGAVQGFNLGKLIRDGQALLSLRQGGSLPASASEAQATDFAELRGAGKFVNGVLKSEQLSAKNPLIRLEGAGEIDLVGETINYLAKPTLVGTASGQGGKELAELHGVVIPIRLTGPLFKPKVQIDWQAALQQKASEGLRLQYEAKKEELQGRREELKQKAAEELGKGLMKLFGGKPAAPATPPAEAPPPQ